MTTDHDPELVCEHLTAEEAAEACGSLPAMSDDEQDMAERIRQWWQDEQRGVKHQYEDGATAEEIDAIRDLHYKMRDRVMAALANTPKIRWTP